MKKYLLIFILTFSLVACSSGPVRDTDNSDSEEAKEITTNTEESNKTDDSKVAEKTEETKVDKSTDKKEEAKFSDSISLTNVKEDSLLVSPAVIEGAASVESGFVMIELRKGDHSLVSESVETVVRDGKFKIEKFWFEFRNTSEGFVAVYDKDNKDNVVEMPVRFQTVK